MSSFVKTSEINSYSRPVAHTKIELVGPSVLKLGWVVVLVTSDLSFESVTLMLFIFSPKSAKAPFSVLVRFAASPCFTKYTNNRRSLASLVLSSRLTQRRAFSINFRLGAIISKALRRFIGVNRIKPPSLELSSSCYCIYIQ